MTDTPPDVERTYREMIMNRTPSERVAMASRMFDAAKAVAVAGIRAEHGDLSDAELQKQVFLRLFGKDFSASQRRAILDLIDREDDVGAR